MSKKKKRKRGHRSQSSDLGPRAGSDTRCETDRGSDRVDFETPAGVRVARVGDLNQKASGERIASHRSGFGPSLLEGLEITPEYRRVVALLKGDCPIILVTGKAGTGKSTLISYIRETVDANLAVVAPTGVAALQSKGVTINSFFRFPPRVITDEDIQRVKGRKLYSALDVLVIDEISMVRADVLDAIDKFLRLNARFPERPFGGVKVLMVGDLFQLPPVVARKEEAILFEREYLSPYFFSAKCLQDYSMASMELTKVFRQKDEQFTELLNKVRVADELEDALLSLNQACYGKAIDAGSLVTLTCTNATADQVNARKLAELPGPEKTFAGEVSGSLPVDEEKLPSPMALTLKTDAQVMFTKNDEQKRWVNGSLGRVRRLSDHSVQVELIGPTGEEIYDIPRVRWETYKYAYDESSNKIIPTVIGTYKQYPLMLAWAVTIHKSQGKTLERVEVDLGRGAFAPGQVYVALSRCRTLQGLFFRRPIKPEDVKCDPVIKRFHRALDSAGVSQDAKEP
jgi:ATP-dependent DNA helicase PIF1